MKAREERGESVGEKRVRVRGEKDNQAGDRNVDRAGRSTLTQLAIPSCELLTAPPGSSPGSAVLSCPERQLSNSHCPRTCPSR